MVTKKKVAAQPTLSPLAARFASQPVLIAEDMKSQFEALIAGMTEQPEWAQLEARAATLYEDEFWSEYEDERPYVVDSNGILYVPVKGVLLHNFPYQFGNWATGYAYIQKAVERGLDDADVRGIALMIDSPGGMVAGCFEAVDKIYARRDEKPIRAFAHESAYSAAYAIASVASAGIVVSRTGGVGSIGVVTCHVDLSKMYDDMGVKQTFIFAGKHKVDGNSAEPLPADVKARIQARIDELYGVFVSSVARNRGMEEQAVRDTEALTYTATQAVSIGLADSIGPLDDAVAQFCVDLSTPDNGDVTMSKTDNTAVVEQAVNEKAVADPKAEGFAEGQAAAVTRIGAILGSEEAKGREDLAKHFAFKTGLSAEDAIESLKASPKAAAAPAAAPAAQTPAEGGFEAAMADGNPEVGASAPKAEDDRLASIMALATEFGVTRKR